MRRTLAACFLAAGLNQAAADSFTVDTSQYLTATTGGQITSMGGGRAPSTLFVATTPTLINTAAETSAFGTGVGPGQIITATYAGNKFRLQVRGNYIVPVANTATITLKVKWGSTVVASFTAAPVPGVTGSYPFSIDETCTVQTIGAAGAIMCNGGLNYATVLTAVAPFIGPLFTTTAATINTTTASKLDITATWSGVAGGQSATVTEASLEVLY